MFYPTGNNTEGRVLVCMKDHEDKVLDLSSDSSSFLDNITEWLGENNYCVEKWQLKEYMKTCGCDESMIEEMEGGDGGGGFASLGSTPGMGDVSSPSAGGTNLDFYSGDVGSGDIFTTLYPGTPAAKKKKGKRKDLSLIKDFDKFVNSMKKNQ